MLLSISAFIVVFTIVVLVHEFGHFMAARRAGVKVYEFSIGFPFSPKIMTLFRSRETEFTVRLLPLGGFVSFSKDGDNEELDLFEASALNRALILSAGSLSNIAFAFFIFVVVFIFGKGLSAGDSVATSAGTIWRVIAGTVNFIANIFSGRGTMEGLAGPVGIAVIAGKAAAGGLLNLVYFTGMLSLSLGIMNLLPLPALDGGHLLMLLIERLKRKPLSAKTYQTAMVIGLAMFLLLTLFVTYRDIVKIIG